MPRRYLPGSETISGEEAANMKVCATVLLGPGSEKSVVDAIRSVLDAVDGFVLIESGGGYEAVDAAIEAAGKQPFTHLSEFRWTGSYADARNEALRRAERYGYDFAITLDPDERIIDAARLRAEIEKHPQFDVFTCRDRDERYFKERAIRCTAPLRWHGRVCEQLIGQTRPYAKIPVEFWELPKDEAGHRRRHERGVVECQRMIDEGDDCYRWRRHMATCLLALGRRDEGVVQLQKAHALAVHDEDRAWVWFLLCEQKAVDGDLVGAMRDAAEGLIDHAGFLPEFGWVIARCQYEVGNLQNASRWAQLARDCPDDRTRLSFRGLWARTGARDLLARLRKPPRPAPILDGSN